MKLFKRRSYTQVISNQILWFLHNHGNVSSFLSHAQIYEARKLQRTKRHILFQRFIAFNWGSKFRGKRKEKNATDVYLRETRSLIVPFPLPCSALLFSLALSFRLTLFICFLSTWAHWTNRLRLLFKHRLRLQLLCVSNWCTAYKCFFKQCRVTLISDVRAAFTLYERLAQT